MGLQYLHPPGQDAPLPRSSDPPSPHTKLRVRTGSHRRGARENKNLGAKISNAVAEFKNLIVESLTVGKSDKPTGITLYDEVTKQPYCLSIANGQPKSTAGICSAVSGGLTSESGSGTSPPSGDLPQGDNNSGDSEPPVITILGNNPATMTKGTPYADLGATVTDNVSENLGLHYYVNGLFVMDISLDTNTVGTSTIDYVATDQAGNTATSTRTVIISEPTTNNPPPTTEEGTTIEPTTNDQLPPTDTGTTTPETP